MLTVHYLPSSSDPFVHSTIGNNSGPELGGSFELSLRNSHDSSQGWIASGIAYHPEDCADWRQYLA